MTQVEKVLSYLKSGRHLNAAQAKGLFGVSSLKSVICKLRAEGHAIYSNTRKGVFYGYRLGRPNRRMVASAYRRMGSVAFQ